MSDIKKLLARIGTARDAISRKEEQTSLDYMIDGVLMNCSVMLKEQEAEISKISNAYLDLVGKASKQPEIVRCRDCKHYRKNTRYPDTNLIMDYCVINAITGKNDDWFCADGKRKD